MENKSLLVNQLIPAHTECPYKDRCNFANHEDPAARCKHKGLESKLAFSCGLARFFDMVVDRRE